MDTAPACNIVLIGFMGSGKTEVGREIAGRIGRSFVDVDTMIEADAGMPIPDIFASEGEPGFRRRERAAVARAARTKKAIISTGGGAVLAEPNVKALKKNGLLVYLRVGAKELERRLEDSTDRPMIDGTERIGKADKSRRAKRIHSLLAEREPAYEAVADLIVDGDSGDVTAVAREVLRRLEPGDGTDVRTVPVAVRPGYEVVVGRSLLEHAADFVALPKGIEKVCIVSHPRVLRLWADKLRHGLEDAGVEVTKATFPEGDERKTLDNVARLYQALARAQFHRSDVVFALGGGVVGDVAGFVASTYNRGIAVVQVPTTLLAMVDAAIGGKTGFNLPQGKNLIGTFHQPAAVLADLDTLATLPERELRGGLAEVAKYACIADASIGDVLESKREDIYARGDVIGDLVVRSASIKADIVAGDEREDGRRAYLNYGHTVGHALEAMSMSGAGPRMHHGEAISIGMVYAALLARELGLSDEVEHHRRVLSSVGLPIRPGRERWDDVRRYMQMDKKYERGVRFVLLDGPARPRLVGDIKPGALESAWRQLSETE